MSVFRRRAAAYFAPAWRLLTALLLLTALASPGPVLAAPAPQPVLAPQTSCDLVVSTTADAGAGSLRDAVGCAVSGNTVTFDAGLAGQTISLTSGEIMLNFGITIDGSGAPGVIVDAGNTSRIFAINPSETVTLTALIVQHGTADYGGAINATNPLLVLNQVAVLSSTATTTSGGGGLSSFGPVQITGGRFQGNQCTALTCVAGALRASNTAILTDTEFLSNTSDFYGGAADLIGAATVTGGRFENNRCTGTLCTGAGLHTGTDIILVGTDFISNTSSGGGALFAGGALNVTGGLFERNQCTHANCTGGAIRGDSTITLTGTEFLTNTSSLYGGAVYTDYDIVISNGVFQDNACTNGCYGGAVAGYSTLVLTNTNFISNTSVYAGGGAYSYDVATITGGAFTGNSCTGSGCYGGGFYTDATLVISGTTFTSNTATGLGGGAAAAGVVAATNSTFTGNSCSDAACHGGGLHTNNPLTLTNSSFINNASTSGGGGVYGGTSVWVTGGQFTSNTCSEADCHGAGLFTPGALTMAGTQFLTNTAQYDGGGAYANNAALLNGSFRGNACQANPCQGGGLFVGTTLTISGTQFVSNTSTYSGSGATGYDTVVVWNALFRGNACGMDDCLGAGLIAYGTLAMTGTHFISNTTYAGGSGLYVSGSANVASSRFQGNSCSEVDCQGGGLYAADALTLTNTSVLTNSAGYGGGGLYAMGPATLTDSLVQNNQCAHEVCQGGGVWAVSSLTATGTSVVSNTSHLNGGGLYAAGEVSLNGGQVRGNTCTEANCRGGGLFTASALVVTSTTFISNTATQGAGGAHSDGDTAVQDGSFMGNSCTGMECRGGGLVAYGNTTLTGATFQSNISQGDGGAAALNNETVIVDSLFANNACQETDEEDCRGGALVFNDGSLTITSTTFLSNTSNGDGGAIVASDTLLIWSSTFQGNECLQDNCRGGALGTSARTNLIQASTFTGNTAVAVGGAVAAWRTAKLTMVNSTLSENTAELAGGGLYAGESSQTHLLNLTIADNEAPFGSGLYVEVLAQVGLTNTLVANNGAVNCGGQLDFGTNNLEWPGSSCDTVGPSAGFSSGDPLLGPLADNTGLTKTRALGAGSAAIDAGDNATCAGPLVNNRDQRNKIRPSDGDSDDNAVCDIGAYEAPAVHGPHEYLLYLPLTLR